MDENQPSQTAEHSQKCAWVSERLQETSAASIAFKRRSFLLSWCRFITFVMIPVGAYATVSEDYQIGLTLIGVGLTGFIVFVRYHTRTRTRVQRAALLAAVLEESANRLNGQMTTSNSGERPDCADQRLSKFFSDDSQDYVFDLSQQELVDIDVFGAPLSLFGLLNRTSTPSGSRRLADALMRPCASKDEIETRQAAVRWLADHPAKRFQFMAAAAGMRALSQECDQFCTTIAEFEPLPQRSAMRAAQIWSIVAGIGMAIVLYRLVDGGVSRWEWLAALAAISLNVSILQRFRNELQPRIRPWLALDDMVGAFGFFVRETCDQLPPTGRLGELRSAIESVATPPALPALERVIPFSFLGLAGLMHTIINYVTLWDLHVVLALDRCVAHHRNEFRDALRAMAELESFTSLAAYAWETPDAIFPSIVDPKTEALQLDIDDGRHPLIAPSEAVCNSVQLGTPTKTYIITGSNMSGKSTFLRMTGCNLVMAQIGSAVPARRMRLTPMRLMTDLRIRDDLSRHESYFLAEVRQVKRMVEATARNEPILALIDEPFRGTNSAERVAAAVAVVRSLTRSGGLHMVATHDEALTALADDSHVRNYHFAEKIDSEALVFDYQIHDGPSRTRNALRVLELEAYPKQLIEEATKLAQELSA